MITPTLASDETPASLKVTPLEPTIGAEISGIDLRHTITETARQTLNDLWIKYKVLFFRDQDLTREQHIAFARCFGELESHDTPLNVEGYTEIVRIYTEPNFTPLYTNYWHTDASFFAKPTKGAVLRAISVPEVGGDTLFADMAAAYRGLPLEIKEKIQRLTAVHDGQHMPDASFNIPSFRSHVKNFPSSEHPVIFTHPESGEKILYVNTLYTTHIIGLPAEEGTKLLQYLCAQACIPEYQVRFRWRNNSIAVWDNRSTQHYASLDYQPAKRYLERIAIAAS